MSVMAPQLAVLELSGESTPVKDLLGGVARSWRLLPMLAKQDYVARYRSAMLGLLWSVFLPLHPDLAVHWSVNGTFSRRAITEAEVQYFNRLVAEKAIRQRFARERLDFPA